jgi:hypothetical protein
MPGTPGTPGTPETPGTPGTPGAPGTGDTGTSAVGGGGGESGSDSLASASPNMIGDFLGAYRSAAFFIARDGPNAGVYNIGLTNITNAKVSEDNSPLVRDRAGFRYNFFSNAASIKGLSNHVVPAPQFGPGVTSRLSEVRDYDTNQYTLNYERTFFDRMASLEVRVPFTQSLSSHIDYNVGRLNGVGSLQDRHGNPVTGFNGLDVTPTPQNTFGTNAWELGNITLILKALLYQNQNLYVSGGFATTAPTARDSFIKVTDYLGDPTYTTVISQRVRTILVHNDTWGLSPFVAGLYTPNDRFFLQGFAQVDFPLNSSSANFTETIPVSLASQGVTVVGLPNDPRTNTLKPPYAQTRTVREQTLMHLDLGAGYWVMRDPSRRWLTGFAPTAELHYTSTLTNAGLATFNPDASFNGSVANPTFPPFGAQVGNMRNRLDILNATVGATFLISDRATLATAVALPVFQGDNRTFDWEFQVQFNWYFGGLGRRYAPPSF